MLLTHDASVLVANALVSSRLSLASFRKPPQILLSLTYPWRSPWCSNSFLSLVIEIVDCFCFVAS